MGKAFINDENLTGIANAIRAKLGVNTQYLPSEMADAINSIPTGEEIKYFYVEDASGQANTLTIKKSNNALPDKVFEWSYDKTTWTEITIEDTTGVSIPIAANGRVYLRGDNEALATSSNYTYIASTGQIRAGGDATTLLVQSGSQMILRPYSLSHLFFNATHLIDAQDVILPSIYLAQGCYQQMFAGCVALQEAPKLPALNLAQSCYDQMFSGCTVLVAAPELPATTLAQSCYSTMFSQCKALTTTPILPAASIPNYGYYSMFNGCTHLQNVKVYAMSWPSGNATMNWLNGVAATGDFYNLGGATIPTGTNGIPSGWTEHTEL